MASTLLELIEIERERVQDLRTHFVIAAAVQTELDTRVETQTLIYDNTSLHQIVMEHRFGLIQRVAGWATAITAPGGFLDSVVAGHLGDLHALPDTGKKRDPALVKTMQELFGKRFPGAAVSGEVTTADIDAIRSHILDLAKPFTEYCEQLRRLREGSKDSPRSISLSAIKAFITEAEDLVNDFHRACDGKIWGFSDHHPHPSAEDSARDIVDLTLLGSIDRMMMVTGVNQRLGESGAWWWQCRDAFWDALAKLARENPELPFNDAELIRAVATRIESQELSTPQVERLVNRYVLEYARYEAAARHVEDRLRRVLGRERVKALIGSRAKDPESFRGKLHRKRKKYRFRDLEANLGNVVTDLAGVRVILYDEDQLELLVKLIKEQLWTVVSDEPHNTEYKARHLTVRIKETEHRAIDGAACEIQLTSLAAHAFNELEHDIRYKDQDVAPGASVNGLLHLVHQATGTLSTAIRQLLSARKDELAAHKTVIANAMDLGSVLDRFFGRRMTGDFEALLWLWQGIAPEPLTREYVEQTAPILLDRLGRIGEGEADATRLALALAIDAPHEIEEIAHDYHDQDSALIRAILDQSVLS